MRVPLGSQIPLFVRVGIGDRLLDFPHKCLGLLLWAAYSHLRGKPPPPLDTFIEERVVLDEGTVLRNAWLNPERTYLP